MVERAAFPKDLLSKLVVILLALTLVETVNPQSGNLKAAVVGLLFMAAPLLWFFVGKEFADRKLALMVLATGTVIGVTVALYGLWQTAVGFPDWDKAWVARNGGYDSLNVLGSMRAFGTLSSSAEYATYLGLALTVAVAGVLRRSRLALVALPVLGSALFLASTRSIVVLSLISVIVMLGLRTGNLRLAVPTIALAAGLLVAVVQFAGSALSASAIASGNPLIVHQVTGLMNPFDPDQSTLLGHSQMLINGLSLSLNYPLGLGTAATNQAGLLSGSAGIATEVDISNEFVSLGPLGGLLFICLLVTTLWRVARLTISSRGIALAVTGVLIVTFGQWLNGGYYAVAPLVWFLIGWANRAWIDERQASRSLGISDDPSALDSLNASMYQSSTVDAVRVRSA
jgi:hypothetical protein